MDTQEWTHRVKVFISYVNLYQRVSIMEKALNSQLDQMTSLMSINLCYWPFQCLHNGNISGAAMVAVMEAVHGSTACAHPYRVHLVTTAAECPNASSRYCFSSGCYKNVP